jgi:hypothetical protein
MWGTWGKLMLSNDDFISLEFSIGALRRTAPAVLSAIATAVKAYRPSDYISTELVISRAYGKPIPGFAITYAQLSAYLDLAVTRHASVLIETDAGVVHSEHVFINRSWLLAQNEQMVILPGVAQAIALRSSGTQNGSVTSLYPQLEDQTPEAARAELRRLKIQIERNLVLPGADLRDREIETFQAQLVILREEKSQTDELNAALARTIRMLTLENDQLRKARVQGAPSRQIPPINQAARPPSNVEQRNAAIREARAEVAKIGKSLWASPDLADCRTGKMAQIVRDSIDPKYAAHLPETNISLGRWLSKDAAPASAKRGGRPSKSDPNK